MSICPNCKKETTHEVPCNVCGAKCCLNCINPTGRCDWCEDAVTEDH